jgi:putative transposase
MRLLNDSAVCELFLEKLESVRSRLSFRVYGYVLMPEHVHLLLSEPDHGTLADALHSLKLSVSKAAQRRCPTFAKPGCPTFAKLTWGLPSTEHTRLWQSRYYDRNVRDYEEFRGKLRYIHRNRSNAACAHGRKNGRGAAPIGRNTVGPPASSRLL